MLGSILETGRCEGSRRGSRVMMRGERGIQGDHDFDVVRDERWAKGQVSVSKGDVRLAAPVCAGMETITQLEGGTRRCLLRRRLRDQARGDHSWRLEWKNEQTHARARLERCR